MELDMPERNTMEWEGEVHPNIVSTVNEDLARVKEFVAQDQTIFKDAKKHAKPQIKRPGTAKNKGNLINTDDDIINRVENHQKKDKFPMKNN